MPETTASHATLEVPMSLEATILDMARDLKDTRERTIRMEVQLGALAGDVSDHDRDDQTRHRELLAGQAALAQRIETIERAELTEATAEKAAADTRAGWLAVAKQWGPVLLPLLGGLAMGGAASEGIRAVAAPSPPPIAAPAPATP